MLDYLVESKLKRKELTNSWDHHFLVIPTLERKEVKEKYLTKQIIS